MNPNLKKSQFHWLWLLSALFGAGVFFMVLGPLVLDPSNIGWLAGGFDPTQHYLGWAFFRQSPWTLPLGLNPNFGLDISSSIVYSDSIPLFAFLFKFFAQNISGPFQYFGIWMLFCFVLQGIAGWKLMSLITTDHLPRLICTIYFLFAPILLWRFVVTNSLAAQFLILFSLYLVLQKKHTFAWWLWVLLLSLAASIHFYLLAMVGSLWIVSLVNIDPDKKTLQVLKSRSNILILTTAILVLVFWQAGYFAVRGGAAASGSYGIGHLNVLGLFDSSGYSYVLPDIKETPASYNSFDRALSHFEGFSYLGLGMLLCLGFALWGLRYQQVSLRSVFLRYRPLVIMLGLLTVFAISNNVGIGPWNFTFPIPDSVRSVASILRASARMFWPVYYALMLLIFYIIIKSYSRKTAIAILAIGLVIQIADTSAGWLPKRQQLMQPKSSEWGTSLTDPFWGEAAKKYKKIVRIAAANNNHNWETFAYYAVRNHLATNSIFLARVDEQKMITENHRLNLQIKEGKYDPDTLYILENDKVIPALKSLNRKSDLLASIDGFSVLAPGWLDCKECLGVPEKLFVEGLMPYYHLDEPIVFGRSGKNIIPFVLLSGWAYPEAWGTWSDGRSAKLVLPLPSDNPSKFVLKSRAFVFQQHPQQILIVRVNEEFSHRVVLEKDQGNEIIIPIPPKALKNGYLMIDFEFQAPLKPKDVGFGDDERSLAIGIESGIFIK